MQERPPNLRVYISSALLENIEEILHRYYIHSMYVVDMFGMFKSLTTHWSVTRRELVCNIHNIFT